MNDDRAWSNPPPYGLLDESSAPMYPQYQAPQMQPVYNFQQPC